MARRREPEPEPRPASDGFPPELATVYVEDWAPPPTEDEIADYRASVSPTPLVAEARGMLWWIAAWMAARDARIEWARRKGLDWRRLPGRGAPRWKNDPRLLPED